MSKETLYKDENLKAVQVLSIKTLQARRGRRPLPKNIPKPAKPTPPPPPKKGSV